MQQCSGCYGFICAAFTCHPKIIIKLWMNPPSRSRFHSKEWKNKKSSLEENLKTSQKAVAQPSVPADLSSWKPLLTPTEVFSLHQLLPQKTAIIVEKVVLWFWRGCALFSPSWAVVNLLWFSQSCWGPERLSWSCLPIRPNSTTIRVAAEQPPDGLGVAVMPVFHWEGGRYVL